MVKSLIRTCTTQLEHSACTATYHKTFELLHCDTAELRDKSYRMRHNVYCQEHSHECETEAGSYLERDEFDERAVHFILKHRISHEMAGTLRVILPNDETPNNSFPMQKHCDHPFLQSDSNALRVCEISRFCMAPRFRQRDADGDYLSAYHAVDESQSPSLKNVIFARRRIAYPQAILLHGAFETALESRIMDCVWMVEPKHLESLARIGFDYRILGPQLEYHGGMQPLIFNIKHVLDTMKQRAPGVWEIVSDGGRLQHMADEFAHYQWQDGLLDGECLQKIYEKLAF